MLLTSRRVLFRFAQRVLPVETVCYASVAEIVAKVTPLLKRHFGDAEAPTAATKVSMMCLHAASSLRSCVWLLLHTLLQSSRS